MLLVNEQALRVFVEAENYPILIHCIHGKDRTGAAQTSPALHSVWQAVCHRPSQGLQGCQRAQAPGCLLSAWHQSFSSRQQASWGGTEETVCWHTIFVFQHACALANP